MGAPWMKFYPRDWRGDQALRSVSLAARGFWLECLCIMHEARPYGHLLLNGDPVGDDALARMVGASVDEVRTFMSELQKAGVLSMTRAGVVFSRRMTKDHARAQNGAKSVKKRWSQVPENDKEKAVPNRSPNRDPITQKPEARSQKEDVSTSSAGECPPEATPEVALRRKIVAAYGDNIPPDTGYIAVWMAQGYDPIICGAVVEAACQRGKRPKALKWFDEAIREAHDRRAPPPPPPAKPVAPLDLSKTTVSRWNQLIDTWRFSGEWPERMYGPPPDNPGCKVPVEILELDRKRNGAAA